MEKSYQTPALTVRIIEEIVRASVSPPDDSSSSSSSSGSGAWTPEVPPIRD